MRSDEELKLDIIKLISYMIVSAKGLVREPKLYGSFRLLDSISRLVDILRKYGLATDEMLKIKAEIDGRKVILMSSREEFKKLLYDLTLEVAKIIDKL